jgi:predicted Ser/Thr protein kinase
MPTHEDVAFGRLVVARGLLPVDTIRQAYARLQPGQTLMGLLLRHGMLDGQQALKLKAELGQIATRKQADLSGTSGAGPSDVARPIEDSGDLIRPIPPAPPGSNPDAEVTIQLQVPFPPRSPSDGLTPSLASFNAQSPTVASFSAQSPTVASFDAQSPTVASFDAQSPTIPAAPPTGAEDAATVWAPGPSTHPAPPGGAHSGAPISGRSPTHASPSAGSGATGPGKLPQPGETVKGYRVESVLGQGGMGAVYRAQAPSGEAVALKVMLPGANAGGEAVERFRREAEAVAKVDTHQGIVRVRDFGTSEGGLPYAVMNLIEGRDLHAIVGERGALPVEEALELMAQVSEAMDHCHKQGVLHRDLKPANILIQQSDGKPFVTDFGLALDASLERLTATGTLMGTPAYMPPEQAAGEKQAIDRRTDVYALGAVLYHLVTGKAPFKGSNLAIIKQIYTKEPPRLQEARGGRVPPGLQVICSQAMAKEPHLRYATAGALAADLTRLRRGEPIEGTAPSFGQRFGWRLKKRDKGALALVTLAIVALLSLPTGAAFWLLRAPPELREHVAWFTAAEASGEGEQAVVPLRQLLERVSPIGATDSDGLDLLTLSSQLTSRAQRVWALKAGSGEPPLEGIADALAHSDQARDGLILLRQVLQAALAGNAFAEGLSPADVAALGLVVAGEGEAERRRHLAWLCRLLLAWEGRHDPDPELDARSEALLQALATLRWNVPPEPKAPLELATVEQARAELAELAADGWWPAASVVERLAEVDADVDAYVTSGLDDAGLPKQWSAVPATTEGDEAGFAQAKQVLFRTAKHDQLLACLEALHVRLTAGEAWFEPGGLEILYRQLLQLRRLAVVSPTYGPAVPQSPALLSAGRRLCDRLIEVNEARVQQHQIGATGDLPLLVLRCVYALSGFLDWSDETLTRSLSNAVQIGMLGAMQGLQGERNSLLPIETLLLLPLMRQLYSPLFQSQAVEYLEGGAFDEFLREPANQTGNTYLAWGQTLELAYDNHDEENRVQMLQKHAIALDSALTDEERQALGLDPATTRGELRAPLSPWWVVFCRWQVAYWALELEEDGDDEPDADIIRASLAMIEECAADPTDFPEYQHWALANMDLGEKLSLLQQLDPEHGKEHVDKQLAVLRRLVDANWQRIGWIVERNYEALGVEEGSLHGTGAGLDMERLVDRIQLRAVRALGNVLTAAESPEANLELLQATQAKLKALGQPLHLRLEMDVAMAFAGVDEVAEAEAAAQRVIDEGTRYLGDLKKEPRQGPAARGRGPGQAREPQRLAAGHGAPAPDLGGPGRRAASAAGLTPDDSVGAGFTPALAGGVRTPRGSMT